MAIAPLTLNVPKGTVVQVSIRLPTGSSDGFRWVADRSMTIDEARDGIEGSLLQRFLQAFLPRRAADGEATASR